MLQIVIPAREFYDEEKEEFFNTKEYTLSLEHSLVSISKWEARWHKPFISNEEKTTEEQLDYVKAMTITQRVPDFVYDSLSVKNMKKINNYIEDTRTATFFTERKNPNSHKPRGKKEVITSELIYYWMIALEIPMECQKWHFNRLMTLIRICNIKNNKNPKKMGKKEILKNNSKLNKSRRNKLGTSG